MKDAYSFDADEKVAAESDRLRHQAYDAHLRPQGASTSRMGPGTTRAIGGSTAP